MNNFDDDTLVDLERLCKIKLTKEEKVEIKNDIFRILNFIEELDQVDTSKIKSTYTLLENQQIILREDLPSNTLKREELLKNAPEVIAGMIKVPTIIDQN
ncbi:MAG: Aspartyl/glutamyl-tRNA(Asn/Gln) amidotransferase subunit C [Candidatus Anoxychlamydiales bacterium]|nr:Aspartyl/glutamyl-tRNA(Asn/Gln) amidotransferase subunit C [Candidatus Anoxychlamydiales bacterium]